ncbi:MAG: hypothetical protein IT376_02945 [Polyangiaceae bacterium]|nr:hypothetical protein [Polyangiaceae bacterium]
MASLVAAPAAAAVTQPDGSSVPRTSGGEIQLQDMFNGRGEPIDAQAAAATLPETFSPLCEFSAEFLLRQAGGSFPLGWYNAVPGSTIPPGATQIFEVVACNTAPGAIITSSTIKSHPAYAGGLVGFALANGSGCVSFANPGSVGQIHYTESRFNTKHLSGQPWVMALIYDSKVEANAFYIAFEDGSPNAFAFNNDGDYNDFTVLLRGLVCAGGGGPCETGRQGVCAPGVEICESGALVCKGLVPQGTESCNGLDDDCDGAIDQGDLCPPQEICDHGRCVKRCSSGEFPCAEGTTCNASDLCVDPACATVTCAAGELCVGGSCVAPCDGVTCPHGDVCRAGTCVDPCAGVTCGTSEVCEAGICRPACACRPCGGGLECEDASGRCVPAGCEDAGCASGTHCETGIGCVDDCAGAVCPGGGACVAGECQAGAAGGGGTGGGSPLLDGGISVGGGGLGGSPGAGGSAATGTGGGAAAGGASGGAAGLPKGAGYADADSGCGCRTAPAPRPSVAALAALALALALASRRRPRARR